MFARLPHDQTRAGEEFNSLLLIVSRRVWRRRRQIEKCPLAHSLTKSAARELKRRRV